MASLEQGLYELGWLDQFAGRDTPVHRIDPRAKVIATFVYILCVVSFDKYDVLGLIPFMLFPVVLVSESDMPAGQLWRRLAAAAPFAIMVGLFNPLLDRAVVATLGPLDITAGMVSYLSILVRFALTTSAAIILVAVTGMNDVCLAVERMGAPKIFAIQLLFMYRYLFVLAEEVMRIARARSLRSFGKAGMGVRVYGNILGHLLLRTIARAQRVYDAMLCRGFDGTIRTTRGLRMRGRDWGFVLGWSATFLVFRLVNIPLLVGDLVTRVIS